MKLEMQMTNRDKKLLIFLAIFVIVVGIGYWGLLPQIRAINEIKDDIISEEDKMFLDDMKVAELPFLMDENEELEEGIVEARSHFYPIMTSDGIDKMLTFMVLDYNLQAYDLSINMPTDEADLEAYQYSQKYVDDQNAAEEEEYSSTSSKSDKSGKDDEEDDDDIQAFTEYEEEPATGIYAVKTNMRLGGEEANLKRLINDLSTTKDTIHLVRYDWHRGDTLHYDDESGEFYTEPEVELNIELVIYMYAEQEENADVYEDEEYDY